MNNEYIKLPDGTSFVSNENGNIEKREDNTSINLLLLENKVEVINDEIKEIEYDLKNSRDLSYVTKYMLLIQPFLIGGSILLGQSMGSIVNGVFSGLVVGVPGTIAWGITNSIAKKRIKGYKGQLKKAHELKNEYQNELEKEKEKALDNNNHVNELVSLRYDNEKIVSSINDTLENAYLDAKHSKPKKLVLKPNSSK